MTVEQTSLEAYESIKPELGDRQTQVLNVISRLVEANNLMISKDLNVPINSITPRVKELRERDLVEEAYKDCCPHTQRRTIFWRIFQSKSNKEVKI